jgi:hypothetical protein
MSRDDPSDADLMAVVQAVDLARAILKPLSATLRRVGKSDDGGPAALIARDYARAAQGFLDRLELIVARDRRLLDAVKKKRGSS